MSHDQAARLRSVFDKGLRSLALRTHRNAPPAATVRSLVVSSSDRRLGTTTLAVHLSIALARQGQRVILVDGDLEFAGASQLCRVGPSPGLADVLGERRTIHEVLQRGPAGIQVVAGSHLPNSAGLLTEHTAERLMRQLAGLARHTDLVVLDIPCRDVESRGQSLVESPLVPFWQQANDLLLVTTSDDAAVMNTYALLKSCWSRTVVLPKLHIAVNHGRDAAEAQDVHFRLDRSSQRFLRLGLSLAGMLPTSAAAASTPSGGDPAFDLALEQMAQRLLSNPWTEEIRTVA